MSNAHFQTPKPVNEPIKAYGPGSPEKAELKAELKRQRNNVEEIPLVIGGKHLDGPTADPVTSPHNHKLTLAKAQKATSEYVDAAAKAAVAAQKEWSRLAWEERAAVFLKAADLLAARYRPIMNAATMLGQSKTAFQAEIDAACELIDFWRFNVHFMEEIYRDQPISAPGMWNRTSCRGLEGFVFAVTPFNFTSIALNLPTAPALMGCSVVWKPAATSLLSSWIGMQVLEEAGLPPGVINMISGDASMIGERLLASPDLAGIHFTGSTGTFNRMWATVGQHVSNYKSYPRLVGETGGKDFVFAHPSADVAALSTALVRGAFEYQGQKCSAASRAFIPKSLWPKLKDLLVAQTNELKMGDVEDFTNFIGAVIDRKAFDRIKGYIDHAKQDKDCEIIAGGECDDKLAYFIRPTIIVTKNPMYRSMVEEIFGPVLTVFIYEDAHLDEAVRLCDTASPYALTGAIFAQDRYAIAKLTAQLENAAGNFYINDKPTGAVVGQQPFGGGRASGTNDKAGSKLNLIRWMSLRTMKETFVPPTAYRYPHMSEA